MEKGLSSCRNTSSTRGNDISEDSKGAGDYWIVRLDATEQKWDRRYGGEDWDFLKDVVEPEDGTFILSGTQIQ